MIQRTVTAIIACKDEPLHLIARAIASAHAAGIREVIVADNSSDCSHVSNVESLCVARRAILVHTPWSCSKGDNLNAAQAFVTTRYILLLDVDTQLQSGSAWLREICVILAGDSKLACVQLTPVVRGGWRGIGAWLSRRERALLTQPLHMCVGHAAMWRVSALSAWRPVLCEDTAQSLDTYAAGYHILRVPTVAYDDAPMTFNAVVTMYSRWTVGTWQLFRGGLRVFQGRRRLSWIRHCLDYFVPYYGLYGVIMVAIACYALVRPPRRFFRTPKV